MSNLLADSLLVHFEDLEDPRHCKGRIHDLKTILTISLVAMICGCDEWTEIEQFGKIKKSLFVNVFGVAKRGIPSHDTFGRLFAVIKPEPFQECFHNWMKALAQIADQISIDGKALRGSHDSFSDQLHRYIVSAYGNESGLVLAQVATDKKSNEITAIPQLLKLLDLRGSTITIDAIGTQTAIAEQITSAGADYVLALKGNQSELNEQVRENFEKVGTQDDNTQDETVDADHGRLEIRRYTVCPVKDYLTSELIERWPGLQTMVMVDNHTEFINGRKQGQIREDRRFFITSLPATDNEAINKSIRAHWGIENSLHYILDVAFREDHNRTRQGNAAINQAVVRHAALNLLKCEKSAKVGIKTKRKMAGWDDDYLLKVLQAV